MTEKEIYWFDEESVKDIVRWALTAQLPEEVYLGFWTHYGCTRICKDEYSGYKPALSRPFL